MHIELRSVQHDVCVALLYVWVLIDGQRGGPRLVLCVQQQQMVRA